MTSFRKSNSAHTASSRLLQWIWRIARPIPDPSTFLVSPLDAIRILNERTRDPLLQERVSRYLAGDIPEYLRTEPALCLSRYIASPNHETLRLLELTKYVQLRTTISQDSKNLFVPENDVKKALCKLPICTQLTYSDGIAHERYEKISIIDFNTYDGCEFHEIKTIWGERLIDFHNSLFDELDVSTCIVDDTEWIDRHERSNLLEHYKKFLSLFVAHGVLFEDYILDDMSEADFVRTIVLPAYRFVENTFGVKPLIAPLVPRSAESSLYWISYPKEVGAIVKQRLKTH